MFGDRYSGISVTYEIRPLGATWRDIVGMALVKVDPPASPKDVPTFPRRAMRP